MTVGYSLCRPTELIAVWWEAEMWQAESVVVLRELLLLPLWEFVCLELLRSGAV